MRNIGVIQMTRGVSHNFIEMFLQTKNCATGLNGMFRRFEVQRCTAISPMSFAVMNLAVVVVIVVVVVVVRRGRKGKGRYSLFYKSRVAVPPIFHSPSKKKKKKSTANDEGLRRAVKIRVPFFPLFRPEHPAESAPLCISMHSGGLVARVRVHACTRVSPVIAARVHALHDLLVRNDDGTNGDEAAPNDVSRVSIATTSTPHSWMVYLDGITVRYFRKVRSACGATWFLVCIHLVAKRLARGNAPEESAAQC